LKGALRSVRLQPDLAASAGNLLYDLVAVWVWLIAAVGLTASTIVGLTPIVSAFHFWLYFTALLAILAGRTLAFVCRPATMFIALTLALVIWNWKTVHRTSRSAGWTISGGPTIRRAH